MVTEEGSWKWNELESVLPDDVLHQLLATPPPTRFGLHDCVDWIHNDKRCNHGGICLRMGGFLCQLMGLDVTSSVYLLVGVTANKNADSLAKISQAMDVSPLREVDSSCHLFLQLPLEALVSFYDDLSCVTGVNLANYD
ncbi:hypothetical protein V6N13_088612 [Hibiscus sabdariffa]